LFGIISPFLNESTLNLSVRADAGVSITPTVMPAASVQITAILIVSNLSSHWSSLTWLVN
jgi:hypothetical protein